MRPTWEMEVTDVDVCFSMLANERKGSASTHECEGLTTHCAEIAGPERCVHHQNEQACVKVAECGTARPLDGLAAQA
jgi:hypothetical protein